jgi:hypothetical protein
MFVKDMETSHVAVEKMVENLDSLMKQYRHTFLEIEKSKEEIKKITLSTKEYCEAVGISRMALFNRKSKGAIPYVMMEGEYRFIIPEKGDANG